MRFNFFNYRVCCRNSWRLSIHRMVLANSTCIQRAFGQKRTTFSLLQISKAFGLLVDLEILQLLFKLFAQSVTFFSACDFIAYIHDNMVVPYELCEQPTLLATFRFQFVSSTPTMCGISPASRREECGKLSAPCASRSLTDAGLVMSVVSVQEWVKDYPKQAVDAAVPTTACGRLH